jgi:serine/threonine protein kinase
MRYPIGEQLPGTKYVVVRKLGQGGMGLVVEVVKNPGIRAVVKIIHPALAADPEFRRRFFEEVRILAKLDHPNIVKVTDCDELADGTPYFAMELLAGSTVRQVLRANGAIHPKQMYEIMKGLLEGLEYVHTHSPPIVHRDVKGENVFIHAPAVGDPIVKLIDFGLACVASAVESRGGFIGTRRYAAPEQFRGKTVTPKSDIYSAALVLYEGITGRGPFDEIPLVPADEGERLKAISRAHQTLQPPPIQAFAPWIPDALNETIALALSKDPAKRPASAQAFASKLFILQYLRDAVTGNTTVQNLNTMAELSSLLEEPPESSTRWGMRGGPVEEPSLPLPTTRKEGVAQRGIQEGGQPQGAQGRSAHSETILDSVPLTRRSHPPVVQPQLAQPPRTESSDRVAAVRTESSSKLGAVRTDSAGRMNAVRTDSAPRMNAVRTESSGKMGAVRLDPGLEAGRHRSFAEAEKAAQARNASLRPDVLPPRTSDPPRIADPSSPRLSPTPPQAPAVSPRAAETVIIPRPTPPASKGPSRTAAIVVATAIPAVVMAIFAIFFLTHWTGARSAATTATAAKPVAPLPAEDPSAAPSAKGSAGGSP